jgi:mono/diheme cytochrome c family protein
MLVVGTAALAAVDAMFVAGSFATAARGAEPAGEQKAFVEKGRTIAFGRCGRCHALGLKDQSPHPQAPPFRLVVERYPSENLAEALAEGIVAGHPDMPVIVLTPNEIEAFLAYLDSLAPEDAPAKPSKSGAQPGRR